MTWSIFIFWH